MSKRKYNPSQKAEFENTLNHLLTVPQYRNLYGVIFENLSSKGKSEFNNVQDIFLNYTEELVNTTASIPIVNKEPIYKYKGSTQRKIFRGSKNKSPTREEKYKEIFQFSRTSTLTEEKFIEELRNYKDLINTVSIDDNRLLIHILMSLKIKHSFLKSLLESDLKEYINIHLPSKQGETALSMIFAKANRKIKIQITKQQIVEDFIQKQIVERLDNEVLYEKLFTDNIQIPEEYELHDNFQVTYAGCNEDSHIINDTTLE